MISESGRNYIKGIQRLQFEIAGGWTQLIANMLIGGVRWFFIGVLFGLGWRVVS